MSTPGQLWHGHNDFAELAALVRQYLAQGGARMSHRQVEQAEALTPLERALTPARH